MGMRRSSFVLEADRQKLPLLGQRRESRSFTTIDPDGSMLGKQVKYHFISVETYKL